MSKNNSGERRDCTWFHRHELLSDFWFNHFNKHRMTFALPKKKGLDKQRSDVRGVRMVSVVPRRKERCLQARWDLIQAAAAFR